MPVRIACVQLDDAHFSPGRPRLGFAGMMGFWCRHQEWIAVGARGAMLVVVIARDLR